MYVKYYAFDGTEFETKEDCEKYEYLKEGVKKSLICLDSDFNRLSFDDYELYEIDGQTEYVYIPNKDTLKFVLSTFGWDPVEIGFNFYNFDTEQWESINHMIKKLVKELNNLEYAMDMLKNFKEKA